MPTEQAARPKLVLATANAHKLTELTRILNAEPVDVDLVGLTEFPGAPDVAETGATFVAMHCSKGGSSQRSPDCRRSPTILGCAAMP
jgi:inosine/xanthosine triphosphate pyrophosphatase family protein